MRDGRFQPTLVVTVDAALDDVADVAASGLDPDALRGDAWWWAIRRGEVAPSQALAEDLEAQGASGLLVNSFAPLAGPKDMNLVLWRWSPDSLRVVDDERRLPRP